MELLLPCIVGDELHLDNQLEEERAQKQSQRKRGESGSNAVKMAVKEPGGTVRGTKKFPHFRIFIIKQICILNISI